MDFIKKYLPKTYYADRDSKERIKLFVDHWRRLVAVNQQLEDKLSNQVQAAVKVNFADLADEVKNDIENRIIKGVRTYGERLKPFNGRDALQDAYEEILDLALYIKQEMKERDSKISA